MKKSLFLLLLLGNFELYCQSPAFTDLWKQYELKQFAQVIEAALPRLKDARDNDKTELNYLLGRAYADNDDFELAIPYLEYAEKNAWENSLKAWSQAYLGSCYFLLEDYDKSEKNLRDCISSKATKNVMKYAYRRFATFGFHDVYTTWKIVESDHFRFHFQEMPEPKAQNFVAAHESAYQQVNNFFQSKLPKKIDFFVWTTTEGGKSVLGRNAEFADAEYCIVHAHVGQTRGHEMTHVISHYAVKIQEKNEFIDQGAAVCFDQATRDKEKLVRDWLVANNAKISIVDVWKNWKSVSEELAYPLSGIFVKELIDTYGRDKFLEFFRIQTYENARQVFGEDLDKLIDRFQKKFNDS